MRIAILAVGRARAGPELTLADAYLKRFDQTGRGLSLGPAQLHEIPESRLKGAPERKAREGEALLAKLPERATAIALDEGGKALTSTGFADLLAKERDAGAPALAFLIGGADGHDAAVLARAKHRLAFGPATWPHMLVRVLLAEQLYRAATILAGHPYHRA